MADIKSFGDLTKAVSSAQELLREPVVSGSGDPAHTPQRATQTYNDVASGTVWNWFAGTWTHQ